MPVDPAAEIEITAFKWVPDFAQGLVRDLRVRWALEEAGLDYRERLLDAMNPRPDAYLREQPFDQVPIYDDGDVRMFETGAIVLHIAERSEALMPRDPQGRARTMSWVLAALNSIEPFLQNVASFDIFYAKEYWAAGAREAMLDLSKKRLGRLSDWLGDREWLEDRFTAGDLMMTTVLRILRHTDVVAGFPNLARYQQRCEARPAFQHALKAQLAAFEDREAGEPVGPGSTRRSKTMTYVEGFVTAVPTANKDKYREHAAGAAPLFKEFGVTRHVEAWGDDLPDGKVTDFEGAVQAKDDETVAFGWFEYPDRATRDAANEKMMSDPRMKEMGETMPFDGKRMIFGGFDCFVEEGVGGRGNYVDGFVLPVTPGKRQDYHDMASKAAATFEKYGATRVVEAWGDDVPDGEVTDFRRAVKAEGDEKVVFSFIEWPDKATRDAGWAKMMQDPEMQPDKDNMPFDGMRMFWGGFAPIIDTAAEASAEASERETA